MLINKPNPVKKIREGVREEHDWVYKIANKMGAPGRTDLAYKVLKTVLHAIRDKLDLRQVFQLSAFLPLCIRGLYFEGYDPENVPVFLYNKKLLKCFRDRMGPRNGEYFEKYLDQFGHEKIKGEELIQVIGDKLAHENSIKADVAFKAVIEVLYEKIPIEELRANKLVSSMDVRLQFQTQDM